MADASQQQNHCDNPQCQAKSVRQRRAYRQLQRRDLRGLHQALTDTGVVGFVLPGKAEQRQPPLFQLCLTVFAAQSSVKAKDQALQVDIGQIAAGRLLFIEQRFNRQPDAWNTDATPTVCSATPIVPATG